MLACTRSYPAEDAVPTGGVVTGGGCLGSSTLLCSDDEEDAEVEMEDRSRGGGNVRGGKYSTPPPPPPPPPPSLTPHFSSYQVEPNTTIHAVTYITANCLSVLAHTDLVIGMDIFNIFISRKSLRTGY
jgi:hypothetical protein